MSAKSNDDTNIPYFAKSKSFFFLLLLFFFLIKWIQQKSLRDWIHRAKFIIPVIMILCHACLSEERKKFNNIHSKIEKERRRRRKEKNRWQWTIKWIFFCSLNLKVGKINRFICQHCHLFNQPNENITHQMDDAYTCVYV